MDDNQEKTRESFVVSLPSSQGNEDGIERQRPVTTTPIRKAWATVATLVKKICFATFVTLAAITVSIPVMVVLLPLSLIFIVGTPFVLAFCLFFLLVLLTVQLRKWKGVFILSCVAVSLDTLFLYIPIIDDKNKCLGMDKTLRNVALVFRSLTDFGFIFHIILLIIDKMEDVPKWDDSNSDSNVPVAVSWLPTNLKPVGKAIAEKMPYWLLPTKLKPVGEAIAKKMPWLSISFIMNCLAILPIPQVTILVGFFKMGGSKLSLKQTIINVFLLFQYLLRLFQIYLSGKELDVTVGKWVKVSFYFFLYIIASHVLGAFWYFFSIQREISCWHHICRTNPGCPPNYDCGRINSLNSTILNKLCPIDSPNTTLFDFGIYLDILQSGNTGSINFPTKFFYSFWWGLRNLSNFGTNLETSSYVWENCFAILICAIGLLLFLYLIGTVQTYIQTETEELVKIEDSKRTRINEKRGLIKVWMSRHGLPDDMKTDFMNNIKEAALVKLINDVVDIQFMMCAPDHEGKTIEVMEFVCVEALKRVPMLQNMDERLLEELSKQLISGWDKYQINRRKHKLISSEVLMTKERSSYIARVGKPVDAVYLIIDGVIERKNTDETTSIITQTTSCYDYYGEELLRWAILNYHKGSSNPDPLPNSPVDVTCQTDVKAFVFSSHDLIKVLHNVSNNISEKLEALARFPQDNTQNKESTTRYLGMVALKKVPLLKNLHEYVLKIICNYLELVSYKKDACVVEAGKPLGFMIFVLRGKIKLTAATTSSSEITKSCDDKILEEGGFYGEQLLSWASPNNISFSDHPVISTHDVKCETEVEALILKAEDLRSAVSKCGSQWNLNNFMSSQKLVDDGRDGEANTGASAPTSTNIEQTIRLHQGHDMILEQLVLIRESMFQRLDDQGQRLDNQGRRLDEMAAFLDNQGRRLDEMAAFLTRLGYTGTSSPPPAP